MPVSRLLFQDRPRMSRATSLSQVVWVCQRILDAGEFYRLWGASPDRPTTRTVGLQHDAQEEGDLRSARWAGQRRRPQTVACCGARLLTAPRFRGCARQHASRKSEDLRSARWAGQRHRPQLGSVLSVACLGYRSLRLPEARRIRGDCPRRRQFGAGLHAAGARCHG